jgi:hypothetical protein
LLGEQLGYLADTETAQRILDGSFQPGVEVDDATALLLEEIGRLGCMLTNGETIIEITATEFQEYWRRAREATSSSYSGVHFGHYKAAGQTKFLSKFFAKKISLIARTGCPPTRWGVGLTVMLEKIAGIALVNKLRAILLMEADFNMHNRIIFGSRMIQKACEEGTIPEELFSSEGTTAEDGTFQKKMTCDISRQSKTAAAITSNDAASCYDRIAHAIASLLFQAYGVSKSACRAMLLPISIMEFYLRTGFGESTTYMGGDPNSKTQGMCQGNTASPAGWEVICGAMLRCHSLRGHGSMLVSPISLTTTHLMGIWYVDDCDLITMAPYCPGEAVWDEAQDALDSWSSLLNATGGALKGDKCFWYPIDYVWHDDGSWSYDGTVDRELTITLPSGEREQIAKLGIGDSRKTLGVHTCPSGSDRGHFCAIEEQAEKWACRLNNSHLPPKWAWISYKLQLWAGLRYGLGSGHHLGAPLPAPRSPTQICLPSPPQPRSQPPHPNWIQAPPLRLLRPGHVPPAGGGNHQPREHLSSALGLPDNTWEQSSLHVRTSPTRNRPSHVPSLSPF